MNDIMTDGEWSYLRQSAVDRMANGTETATIEMTMLVDLVAQIDALRRSRDELISSLDGAMAFKRSVDAALNSGELQAMNQPSTRSFDRSQVCATCGRKRRPLEQRRESWRFDDTPIVPRRENGPPPLPGYSHPGWQRTNDLIVSCNIYRNGGTNEECHLCDNCLRVGLRAIKAEVDAALEETGGSDQTTEIVRLTEELGKALHRCSVLETKVARETTPQPDWIDVQVMLERQQQDLQWGGPEHDDGHSDRDWADFIVHQIQRMAQESGRVPSATPRAIKIMAICRAWLESMDRRGERLARAARKASDVMCHECGCIYQQEHDQDHNRVCPDCMEGHEPSSADRQADVMPESPLE